MFTNKNFDWGGQARGFASPWTGACVAAACAARDAEMNPWFTYPDAVALCGGGFLPGARPTVAVAQPDGAVLVRARDVRELLQDISVCSAWSCGVFSR
jgi:hypothetical protein